MRRTTAVLLLTFVSPALSGCGTIQKGNGRIGKHREPEVICGPQIITGYTVPQWGVLSATPAHCCLPNPAIVEQFGLIETVPSTEVVRQPTMPAPPAPEGQRPPQPTIIQQGNPDRNESLSQAPAPESDSSPQTARPATGLIGGSDLSPAAPPATRIDRSPSDGVGNGNVIPMPRPSVPRPPVESRLPDLPSLPNAPAPAPNTEQPLAQAEPTWNTEQLPTVPEYSTADLFYYELD